MHLKGYLLIVVFLCFRLPAETYVVRAQGKGKRREILTAYSLCRLVPRLSCTFLLYLSLFTFSLLFDLLDAKTQYGSWPLQTSLDILEIFTLTFTATNCLRSSSSYLHTHTHTHTHTYAHTDTNTHIQTHTHTHTQTHTLTHTDTHTQTRV